MGGTIYEDGGTVSPGAAPAPPTTAPTATPGGPTYIKIVVPNFNGAPDNQPQMGSYLRLGAVEQDVAPGVVTPSIAVRGIDPTGEDLASLVHGFTDDLRRRDGVVSPAEPAEPGTPGHWEEVGGGREGGAHKIWVPPTPPTPAVPEVDCAAPALTDSNEVSLATTDARRKESAILHTKGGWRDHSDGNRITTTRGDKVEVIRGNYKLLVLGRSDLPTSPTAGWGNAAGTEISGGQVDNGDLPFAMLPDVMTPLQHDGSLPPVSDASRVLGELYPPPDQPVLETTYEWNKSSDGSWGWKQTTTIGVPGTTKAPANQGPIQLGNNQIINNTWVDQLCNYVGGPALTDPIYSPTVPAAVPDPVNKRVNLIYNRTWVNVLDEATDAVGSISESYRAAGTFDSTSSSGGLMTTTLHSDAQMTNITSSGAHMANKMSCGVDIYNEMTAAVGITTFAGTPINTSLSVSALLMNFVIGVLLEVKLAHVDVHAGLHLDMHIGEHCDIHIGDHFDNTVDKTAVSLSQDEIKGLHNMITVTKCEVATVFSLTAGECFIT